MYMKDGAPSIELELTQEVVLVHHQLDQTRLRQSVMNAGHSILSEGCQIHSSGNLDLHPVVLLQQGGPYCRARRRTTRSATSTIGIGSPELPCTYSTL